MRRVSRALIVKHGGQMDLSVVTHHSFTKVGHMPSGAGIYVRRNVRGRLMFRLSSYNRGEDLKNYKEG